MGGGKWLGIPTGLVYIPTDQWGGLPLTMMLATLSITLAFPLAILVALGRQSTMPAVRSVCIVYVELVRGVPLISVLFMASFMLPLLLPTGTSPDVLIRVLVGITSLFLPPTAEIVRGGLQAIPRGQSRSGGTPWVWVIGKHSASRLATSVGACGAEFDEQLHRDFQRHIFGHYRELV
jgi:His/Glu/Gln/Arg/opine family amino acid ABC transporter permease subunit